MTAILNLLGINRLAAYGIVVLGLLAAVWWAVDAIGDAREAKLRAAADRARAEHLAGSREIENETNQDDDCTLIGVITGGVSGCSDD